MAADDDSKMKRVADAAVLLLVSRLSGPALLGVCSYIAVAVVNLKTDLAQLTGSVNATIAGIVSRVDNLEAWRNGTEIEASRERRPN